MSLVWLHGIGGACWGSARQALGGGLAWDLPGYGGSAGLAVTTFPKLAEALRDSLDELEIERADLLGHSIGGMVAQEFAVLYPQRVRRLILYATTPAFGGKEPDFAAQFLADRLAPLNAGMSMAELAMEGMRNMLSMAATATAMAEAVGTMAAVPEPAYRATLACLTTFDRRADLGKIVAPTLLIAGEHDPLAPPRTMQRMAEAIPGARLAVLPGTGHLAHLEQPAAFAALVTGFLAEG